jgi:hypothetical protein
MYMTRINNNVTVASLPTEQDIALTQQLAPLNYILWEKSAHTPVPLYDNIHELNI